MCVFRSRMTEVQARSTAKVLERPLMVQTRVSCSVVILIVLVTYGLPPTPSPQPPSHFTSSSASPSPSTSPSHHIIASRSLCYNSTHSHFDLILRPQSLLSASFHCLKSTSTRSSIDRHASQAVLQLDQTPSFVLCSIVQSYSRRWLRFPASSYILAGQGILPDSHSGTPDIGSVA